MAIKAILAADPNGVIGVNGTLPWRYKADMVRFKALTTDCAVIMGRKTFESIPVPKNGIMMPSRTMIVVTRDASKIVSDRPDQVCTTIAGALQSGISHSECTNMPTWIIGGVEIYLQMVDPKIVEEIDFTLVPEAVIPPGAEVAQLPKDFLDGYTLVSETQNPDEPALLHRLYRAI